MCNLEEHYTSAIKLAAKSGNEALVLTLIEKGAKQEVAAKAAIKANQINLFYLLVNSGLPKDEAVFLAAKTGNVSVVERLLTMDASRSKVLAGAEKGSQKERIEQVMQADTFYKSHSDKAISWYSFFKETTSLLIAVNASYHPRNNNN